jgi:DNA (cytosine-5)-methyltransferase 1
MRALDLFCGAGGASMGLQRAGYEVVGVDKYPQPHYPFEFVLGEALEYSVGGFDLVWASPPCQRYIRSGLVDKARAVDLVGPTRGHLERGGVPWILENVPGAPMRCDVMLCGSMFGLGVRRHRWFELSFPAPVLTLACNHARPVVGVYGHPHGERGAWPGMLPGTQESWSAAMGIDWMDSKGLAQAIPPAYAEFLAKASLAVGRCHEGT